MEVVAIIIEGSEIDQIIPKEGNWKEVVKAELADLRSMGFDSVIGTKHFANEDAAYEWAEGR
jgi:hypothetical protein